MRNIARVFPGMGDCQDRLALCYGSFLLVDRFAEDRNELEKEPQQPPATMDQPAERKLKSTRARNKKLARYGILFAVLGLLLFAYFVRKAGVSQIMAGIQRLGFGFLLILAISSVRQIARSFAWTRCFESPHSLRFRDAFAARIMGDALGNIVPLASVAVSEPSKAAFVTERVPLMASLAALALENIFYSLSVVLLIFSGTAALLLSFSLPKPLRYASIGALVVTLVIAPLGYVVIRVLRLVRGKPGRRAARIAAPGQRPEPGRLEPLH